MMKLVGLVLRIAGRLRLGDTSANTTMIFAGALPVLISTAGLAFDFGTLAMKRGALQSAADQAAMAGAKQMGLASATDSSITNVAVNYLKGELQGEDATAANAITINHTKNSVNVQLTEAWTPFFAHFLAANVTPIIVNSTAALQGESRVCVLSLNPADSQAFRMSNSARIQAPSCGIYSNSVNAQGMVLQNSSSVTAAVICSAGGIKAGTSQTSVTPQTDCPAVPDPLAALAAPAVGSCTVNNYTIGSGTATLSPGVYCGGISIMGSATVNFTPGTYVIKGGNFSISGQSVAKGANVGFFLKGDALLNFTGTATIDFSGAETGAMAGLLFFGDRGEIDGDTHIIGAANIKQLTGTIYLPAGDVLINPNNSVAANSAYTAMIVNRVRVSMGPTLVMNTNYSATNVPVPDGVRSAATVVLTN